MVKGVRLFLVVGILVALFLPFTVSADTCEWTMQTDNASDLRWYTAQLNGSVSALSVTSTAWGFVMDEYSHGDPGTAAPDATDYSYSYSHIQNHSGAFESHIGCLSMDGLLELGLRPNTKYYYRFAAYYGGECAQWDYGAQLDFTTWVLPPEESHYYTEGYEDILTETADIEEEEEFWTVTLHGSIEAGTEDAIRSYGFVWDTVSHDNPDGWPVYWTDVPPEESGYGGGNEWNRDEDPDLFEDENFEYSKSSFEVDTTYYYRFFVDFLSLADYVYGEEEEFEIDTCTPPDLQPPYDLVAIPITGTEVFLSWWSDNPNTSPCDGTPMWPNLQTLVHMEEWEYPDDPPSTTDGSVVVYSAPEQYGETTYSVYGLTPGTSYYFRVWFYDPDTDNTTTYDEDFCTPYSGITPPSDVDIPDNWFLDPTCDSWDNVPMAMTIINGIYDKMAIPTTTLCLWVNLLLLSCAMTTSYGGTAAVTREMGGSTILVPFIVMCFGFIVGPFIGAFPGFFLAIGVIIGLGVAFAWARA